MHNANDETRSDLRATVPEISKSVYMVCKKRHMATEFLPPAKTGSVSHIREDSVRQESMQRFIETTALLITALVGVGERVGGFLVFFLFLIFFSHHQTELVHTTASSVNIFSCT